MAPASARERDDRAWMRRALVLARRGWGQTAPNPMVGAVVVRDGVAAGRGFHARYGEEHAEVAALRDAGERARGATVYVALEPCNHHGKTPPCVDALIRAGVKRVVAAARDPGRDSGGGAERLRAAGIEVEFGAEEQAARELNAPFFFAATRRDEAVGDAETRDVARRRDRRCAGCTGCIGLAGCAAWARRGNVARVAHRRSRAKVRASPACAERRGRRRHRDRARGRSAAHGAARPAAARGAAPGGLRPRRATSDLTPAS